MSNVTLTPQSPIPSLASQPFAARLQRALHHLRLGRPIILMDDFDRENEADLIVAAVQAANDNAQQLQQAKLGPLAQGLGGMPGLGF